MLLIVYRNVCAIGLHVLRAAIKRQVQMCGVTISYMAAAFASTRFGTSQTVV